MSETAADPLADYAPVLAGLQALLEHSRTLRRLHARVLTQNAAVVAFSDSVAQVCRRGDCTAELCCRIWRDVLRINVEISVALAMWGFI